MARRPPPPPPINDTEPEPPRLPPRPGHGGKPNNADADDDYDQPTGNPSARGGFMASFSNTLRVPVAENSDTEDWSDSEWDDTANLDACSTPDDNTYLMPDGAGPDEYNLPDDIKPMPTPKPPIKVKPLLEVAEKFVPKTVDSIFVNNFNKTKSEIKFTAESNKPKPPPKKEKPSFKPPPPLKVKYPQVLPKPPHEQTATDIHSDDNDSAGSVPSGLGSKLKTPEEKVRSQGKATRVDSEQPIYDDGMSEVLSLYDWYHGELDRDEGMRRVEKLDSKNGTFLIRASKTSGKNNSHPYTLVVTLDRKVYNLMIRLRNDDQRFAIGNYKADEVSFPTVPELVEYHRENNIKLAEGGCVKLTQTPKK